MHRQSKVFDGVWWDSNSLALNWTSSCVSGNWHVSFFEWREGATLKKKFSIKFMPIYLTLLNTCTFWIFFNIIDGRSKQVGFAKCLQVHVHNNYAHRAARWFSYHTYSTLIAISFGLAKIMQIDKPAMSPDGRITLQRVVRSIYMNTLLIEKINFDIHHKS